MSMKNSVKLKCLKMQRSFLNLIWHGVVMEGNRKMTGCLQTFGGHCMSCPVKSSSDTHYKCIITEKFIIHCFHHWLDHIMVTFPGMLSWLKCNRYWGTHASNLQMQYQSQCKSMNRCSNQFYDPIITQVMWLGQAWIHNVFNFNSTSIQSQHIP